MQFQDIESMTPIQITEELAFLEKTHGFVRPSRSTRAKDPSLPFLFEQPDYDKADLIFFRGRSRNHKAGSLQAIVEDAVKSWEFEASHVPFEEWTTVKHDEYKVSANGGKGFHGREAAEAGNYNWLLDSCDKTLYDSEKETFHSSHRLFRGAFLSGFPWEVIEVFSPPPTVAFSWRHWAQFNGEYRGRQGDDKTYDMYGFGILELNDDLKIKDIRIFYKPDDFLKAIQGDIDPEALKGGKQVVGAGCPVLNKLADLK